MAETSSRNVKVGDDAPDFELPSLQGQTIKLSDYRGKKVVLFMWASWWACREQLPVWQQFHEDNRVRDVEVLSVAMDAQGSDKVRPYVEKAEAQFTTVVDEANLLGDLYGFKAIPNGYLIDEHGVVRHKKLGGFDIRRRETAKVVEKWAAGSSPSESLAEAEQSMGAEHSEANTLFRQGLDLYRDGNVNEALACWREGLQAEPDNLIIRKQVWAVQNPERFYDGEVDYGWQRKQIDKGL